MKKIILLSVITLVFGTLVSCTKKEEPVDKKTSTVVGRWQITENNAQYSSFEFTVDKKYIIVPKAQEKASVSGKAKTRGSTDSEPVIIFGDYSTLNGNDNSDVSLNLSEFGTMKVTISNDGQSVSINVNGTNYNAKKIEEMPSNDKTELLCHTWKFKKGEIIDESLIPDEEKEWFIHEYGNDWKVKMNEQIAEALKDVTITFTKAGTYFTHNPNDPEETTICKWEWEDISKGIMKYTAYYEDGEVLDGRGTAIELTSNKFVFQEDYILGTLGR
jgi:hypothetical protein